MVLDATGDGTADDVMVFNIVAQQNEVFVHTGGGTFTELTDGPLVASSRSSVGGMVLHLSANNNSLGVFDVMVFNNGQPNEVFRYRSCDDGFLMTAEGSKLCFPCPPYSIGVFESSYNCQFCPGGRVGPTNQQGIPLRGWRSDQAYVCGACAPGKYRGQTQQTDECTICPVGRHAGAGASECSLCDTGRVTDVNTTGATQCVACPAGKSSNSLQTRCNACGVGNVSTFGAECVECEPPRVANADKTACVQCPDGQTGDGHECMCDAGHYNTSLGHIRCEVDDQPSADACNPCGDCVDCTFGKPPVISPGFVRVVGSPVDGLIMECPGGSKIGCEQSNTTAVGNARCREHFSGHLCKSCAADHFQQGDSCVSCGSRGLASTMIAALIAIVLLAAAAALLRHARNALSDAEWKGFVAIVKSMWQPLRIMITYAQVISQMDAVIPVRFPPDFVALMDSLKIVNIADSLVGMQCFGLGNFRSKWTTSVLVQPFAMAAIVALAYASQACRSDPRRTQQAKKNLYGNAFLALFLSYPAMCRLSLSSWQCTESLSSDPSTPYSILLADDRVLCEDPAHDTLQYISVAIIILVGFCLPLSLALYIRHAYGQIIGIEDTVAEQIATELGLQNAAAAKALHRDVLVGNSFGPLVDSYKSEIYWWESADMIRKLCIVGLPLLFRQSATLQAVVVGVVVTAFNILQAQGQPYKMPLDNTLRMFTEQHTIVVASVATALLSSSRAIDDDKWGSASREAVYSSILIVTFIVMVAVPLLITIVAKVTRVQRVMHRELLSSNQSVARFESLTKVFVCVVPVLQKVGLFKGLDQNSWQDDGPGVQSIVGVAVRMAYARFRIGLATPIDKQRLKNYLCAFERSWGEALSMMQLRELLLAHYNDPSLYSNAEREEYVSTVEEIVDRDGLLEVVRSEGLDISTAKLAALPNATSSTITRVAEEDEWVEQHDLASGHTYYVNQRTRESSWTIPTSSIETRSGVTTNPLDNNIETIDGGHTSLQSIEWTEHYSEEHHRPYWRHTTTGESTWIRPT